MRKKKIDDDIPDVDFVDDDGLEADYTEKDYDLDDEVSVMNIEVRGVAPTLPPDEEDDSPIVDDIGSEDDDTENDYVLDDEVSVMNIEARSVEPTLPPDEEDDSPIVDDIGSDDDDTEKDYILDDEVSVMNTEDRSVEPTLPPDEENDLTPVDDDTDNNPPTDTDVETYELDDTTPDDDDGVLDESERTTMSPTKNPISGPTKNPSSSPLKNPSSSPTKNPSSSPTKNPSSSPTVSSGPTNEKDSESVAPSVASSDSPTAVCGQDCDEEEGGDGDDEVTTSEPGIVVTIPSTATLNGISEVDVTPQLLTDLESTLKDETDADDARITSHATAENRKVSLKILFDLVKEVSCDGDCDEAMADAEAAAFSMQDNLRESVEGGDFLKALKTNSDLPVMDGVTVDVNSVEFEDPVFEETEDEGVDEGGFFGYVSEILKIFLDLLRTILGLIGSFE